LLAKDAAFKTKPLIKIAVLTALFILLFYPVYKHLIARFEARDSYYSHGYLIPFVCLYLVWRKRDILRSITPKPVSSGLFIIIGGVLLHLGGMVLKINFVSYAAIPTVLLGVSLYLGGVRFTKELFFPIIFIIFMLPLPRVMVIGITFKLKIMVAQAATFIADKIGIEARASGSTIYYPGGFLLVGDPCSGLRSLITFIALGALFTQFTIGSRLSKTVLFLSSIPIAFLSNLLRVTFLLLVSYVYGSETALGFLHDSSGVMVFVIGFIGLFLLAKALRCPFSAASA